MDLKGFNERLESYKDPKVAHFLAEFVDKAGEIAPKYDLGQGYRYPEVEESIHEGPAETRKFLRELTRSGILEEKLFDMAIYCPSCNGANVSTNYVCPLCGSRRIVRNALIEHPACGYIDNIKNFRVEAGFICPKCKSKLGKTDFRVAGSWYECSNCRKRVETTRVVHFCRDCRENFVFDEAIYVEVYSYSFSEAAKVEVKSGALLPSILEKFFRDLQYEVEVPGRLTGKSGVQHEFDILLKLDKGRLAAFDILFSREPIGQIEIVTEYGKIFDTNVDSWIVASPSLSQDARELAKTYRINVIEASSPEALNKLKDALGLKAGEKKPVVIKEKKKLRKKTHS